MVTYNPGFSESKGASPPFTTSYFSPYITIEDITEIPEQEEYTECDELCKEIVVPSIKFPALFMENCLVSSFSNPLFGSHEINFICSINISHGTIDNCSDYDNVIDRNEVKYPVEKKHLLVVNNYLTIFCQGNIKAEEKLQLKDIACIVVGIASYMRNSLKCLNVWSENENECVQRWCVKILDMLHTYVLI